MVRSELSRNSEVKAALKKEDALNSTASWMWKTVWASPTSSVTVATPDHLKDVSSLPQWGCMIYRLSFRRGYSCHLEVSG